MTPEPLKHFEIEGEPLLVNAILRELRWQFTVYAEGEYPSVRPGWIGKTVIFGSLSPTVVLRKE